MGERGRKSGWGRDTGLARYLGVFLPHTHERKKKQHRSQNSLAVHTNLTPHELASFYSPYFLHVSFPTRLAVQSVPPTSLFNVTQRTTTKRKRSELQ
jgi:hypothetical protein